MQAHPPYSLFDALQPGWLFNLIGMLCVMGGIVLVFTGNQLSIAERILIVITPLFLGLIGAFLFFQSFVTGIARTGLDDTLRTSDNLFRQILWMQDFLYPVYFGIAFSGLLALVHVIDAMLVRHRSLAQTRATSPLPS